MDISRNVHLLDQRQRMGIVNVDRLWAVGVRPVRERIDLPIQTDVQVDHVGSVGKTNGRVGGSIKTNDPTPRTGKGALVRGEDEIAIGSNRPGVRSVN